MLGSWQTMGLNILHNMYRHQSQIQLSMERLSSGLRINRAADDPAGLAISEKMRAQIRGLSMAARNIQDGISMFNVAEGSLQETHAMLQRMRELSVYAANGTLTPSDREALSLEFEELKKEVTRLSKDTEFNTMPLLDGSRSSIRIQAGANAGQSIAFSIGDMSASAIGIQNASLAKQESSNEAIGLLDDAIQRVSSERSRIGAYVNRLEYAYHNTLTMEENLTAAESRIRDVDIAKEMMALTKANILMQASHYVFAMHTQQAYSVLQLLKPT